MQFEFTLSSTRQRTIALALAFVPAFGLIAGLSVFISAQIDRHAEASRLVRELTRARTILAGAPNRHQKLQELKASTDWQDLFTAKSVTVSAGALSSIIKTSGGKVQTDTVSHLNSSGAKEVDERAVFAIDSERLVHILAILRGRRPLFVIRSISIRSDEVPSAQPRTTPNVLTVDLTVAEFERP